MAPEPNFHSEFRQMLTKRNFLKLVSVFAGKQLVRSSHAEAVVSHSAARWSPLPIGAGGYLTGHSISLDGSTIVCRTDTYGCYIWNRTAIKWDQLRTSTRMPSQDVAPGNGLSEAGGYEVQVAPSDPARIYMVTGSYVGSTLQSHVYISRDRGDTFRRTQGWTPVSLATNGPPGKITNCHMAVDPSNPDVVYLGTLDDGLFVTCDAGESWKLVTSVPRSLNQGYSFSIAFDPTSGTTKGRTNTVYVCSDGNGFFSCSDGSGAFAAMSGGPRRVSDASVSPIDGTLYACARDAGPTNLWQFAGGRWDLLANCTDGAHAAWSVAPDPHDSNRIAVCDGGGRLNISIDHGKTWPSGYCPGTFATGTKRRIANDIPWLAWTNEQSMSAGMIRFDPSQHNLLTFSEGIGFFNSSPPNDTSRSWSWNSQSRGIEQLVTNWICSPPGGKPIIANWDRPIFRIEDRDVYPLTHGPSNKYSIQTAWSADWASNSPATVVAVMNWFPPANDQSGKSLDGGKTWEAFPKDSLPSSTITGCLGGCIAAADALTYMWIPRANGRTPNLARPYITLDGGTNWVPTEPQDLPAGGNSGWGTNFLLNRHILCADRVLPRTFYAYNSLGGFYRYIAGTTPTNGSWVTQSSKLIPHDEGLVRIRSVPSHAGHVFACSGVTTPNNQPYCVFLRTTDGCKNFRTVTDVQCVYAFGFGKPPPDGDYPTVWFAGLYRKKWGIYRSESRLAAWNANTVEWIKIGEYPIGSYDLITCIEGDANEYAVAYVGFSGSGSAYCISS